MKGATIEQVHLAHPGAQSAEATTRANATQPTPAEGGAQVAAYADFLASKRAAVEPCGFHVDLADISTALFGWQQRVVQWSLRRGRAAIFAGTGLGKTAMQIQWAKWVSTQTGQPVLILAPLAVATQTQREGEKFGVPVTVCRSQSDVQPGINVANYEMLRHFDPAAFGGIVLDESSILKSFSGVVRKQLIDFAKSIAYRLCCTATPAPNDLIELTNHAEFLDIMSGKEIIALFFTQDGNTTHKWRLKGHAVDPFYRWLASWSVALRSPADLGDDDPRFVLPDLRMHQVTVAADTAQSGMLFPVEALTLQERQRERRSTVSDRVTAAAELVNASDEPWLVWCDLNDESKALAKAVADAVEVTGSHSPDFKAKAMLDFAAGTTRVLVSKPSICGFGMNWQHCSKVVFVGLSDSFEQFYQAIRRCWRFGQTKPVDVYVVTADTEGAVVRNIQRKEEQAAEMMASLVRHMDGLQAVSASTRDEMDYDPRQPMRLPNWLKETA
jgi:superfamily II DNA or RNA helicase